MNGKEGTITECILGPVPILHMASQHTAAGTQVHTHIHVYTMKKIVKQSLMGIVIFFLVMPTETN